MEQNWPGTDDRRIVAEMLSDRSSLHWEKCCVFIRHLLSKRSVPVDAIEDIMQRSLLSVWKNLAKFRHDCPLECWLTRIVERKAIDEFRGGRTKKLCQSIDAVEDVGEVGYIDIAEAQTVEEQYEVRETLREIDSSIKEFVTRRVHSIRSIRNEQILRLVLFGGYSCEEAARRLKVKLHVVHYVLRTARIYLQKHLRESRSK
ncbi:MAG TPA: RNA polymerase sigma factor [Ktedonobacteraceae bacterium]